MIVPYTSKLPLEIVRFSVRLHLTVFADNRRFKSPAYPSAHHFRRDRARQDDAIAAPIHRRLHACITGVCAPYVMRIITLCLME